MNRQLVQDIVEPLTKAVGVDKARVSLAMAIAIGYALPLPAQAAENPGDWYQEQYRWKINQFVGEFNERYLVDVHVVLNGAKEIWLGRYRQCFIHNQQEIEYMLNGNTPASVFLGQYEDSLRDKTVIASAAFLLQDKLSPILLDMTRPGATVK